MSINPRIKGCNGDISGEVSNRQAKQSRSRLVIAPLFAIQFLSWGGMFCLWIYAVPVIAQFVFHARADTDAYRNALITVSSGFAGYAVFGACLAFTLPALAARFGAGSVYGVMLLVGATGIGMLGVITRPFGLVVAFFFIGVGWSAMANFPYAIAAAAAPEGGGAKFMRWFGFSTVAPQVFVTIGMAAAVRPVFGESLNLVMVLGGAMMAAGGLLALALQARLMLPAETW